MFKFLFMFNVSETTDGFIDGKQSNKSTDYSLLSEPYCRISRLSFSYPQQNHSKSQTSYHGDMYQSNKVVRVAIEI